MTDRWARWLLHDRCAGDEHAFERTMAFLAPVRERVLAGARLADGDVVLDVGCGDGLIGFAALALVGNAGRVILADVSADLLERCRRIAADLGVTERVRAVQAPAETLAGIDDQSVDVVTTRSVLIYVDDKAAAFAAFRRVLRPKGRLSLFEPINRRGRELMRDTLFGYPADPVAPLAARVRAVYEDTAPAAMMDFDETDLLLLAERAGFEDIDVTLQLTSEAEPPYDGLPWATLMGISPNPMAPTFGEALDRALTPAERAEVDAYLRPLVDGGAPGRYRNAVAYVTGKVPRPDGEEER